MYTCVHCFRGTDQKMGVMSPVLLTGLTKVIDQPEEVRELVCLYIVPSHFDALLSR